MSVICPTVTATSIEEYKRQLDRLTPFAPRIHLDFMDGDLAPTVSPTLREAWWPKKARIDVHLMHRQPMLVLEDIIAHPPDLVIVHMEGVHVSSFVHELHEQRISVGIALLQATPVSLLYPFINIIDHILVFSGNLGYQGGSKVDFALLDKVRQIKQIRPDVEIGWDGGINADNIRALADGGVDVLNVGGAIQKTDDPQSAYNNLRALVQS